MELGSKNSRKAFGIMLATLASVIFLFPLLIAVKSGAAPEQVLQAKNGEIILSSSDFNRTHFLRLDGQWQFLFSNDVAGIAFEQNDKPHFIAVPGNWQTHSYQQQTVPLKSYGAYQLKIWMPEDKTLALRTNKIFSAYRINLNQQFLLEQGLLGSIKQQIRPNNDAEDHFIEASFVQGWNTLEIIVGNNLAHQAGIIGGVYLAELELAETQFQYKRFTDVVLFATFLVMAFYHFSLFANRQKDRAPLWFGLICLTGAVRVSLLNTELHGMFIEIPWLWAQRAEYITFYLMMPLYYKFFHSMYPKDFSLRFALCCALFAFAIISTTLLVEPAIYRHILSLSHFFFLLFSLVFFISVIKTLLSKRPLAKYFFATLLFMFVFGINDILNTQGIISSGLLYEVGFVVFIMLQSLILAYRFSRALSLSEKLSDSFARFVPKDFLSHLGKQEIVDVKLGDSVVKEMTVLFADMRSFTSISEKMSPEENFRFLNKVFGNLSPIIRHNHGFIDKYIGDAIMALFAREPDDALRAATNILRELHEFNNQRKAQNLEDISLGFGINSGQLILGTVGEFDRMDSTVISDAVNLAARLESQSKHFNAPIIISEHCLALLRNPTAFNIRELGKVKVRGKQHFIKIYEVYDADEDELIALKDRTLSDWQQALLAADKREVESALSYLTKVIELLPNDIAANELLKSLQADSNGRSA